MIEFCICGHVRSIHYGTMLSNSVCGKCAYPNIDSKNSNWHKNYDHVFKLDNLKFLEQRYEESLKNAEQ